MLCCLEYVEYPDGTITPTSNVNANPAPPPTAHSPVQRAPGRIADYDPLSEARPSPYSARQAATTVIYTSDKGPGEILLRCIIAAFIYLCPALYNLICSLSFFSEIASSIFILLS